MKLEVYLGILCLLVGSANSLNLLVIGDFNAGNNDQWYQLEETNQIMVYDWKTGNWTPGQNPLPGGNGNGASPWLKLAHSFTNHTNELIMMVVIARNDWSIDDFYLNQQLLNQAYNLFSPNETLYVIWQQGSMDYYQVKFEDEGSNYQLRLLELINSSPSYTKWGISLTSYSPNHYDQHYETLIRAQQLFVIGELFSVNKTFAGPDTDTLCGNNRYNNIYWSNLGTDKLANAWHNSIKFPTETPIKFSSSLCVFRYITLLSLFLRVLCIIVFISTCVFCCSACCYGVYFNQRTLRNGYNRAKQKITIHTQYPEYEQIPTYQ